MAGLRSSLGTTNQSLPSLYEGKARREVMSHALLYKNHEHKQLTLNFRTVFQSSRFLSCSHRVIKRNTQQPHPGKRTKWIFSEQDLQFSPQFSFCHLVLLVRLLVWSQNLLFFKKSALMTRWSARNLITTINFLFALQPLGAGCSDGTSLCFSWRCNSRFCCWINIYCYLLGPYSHDAL